MHRIVHMLAVLGGAGCLAGPSLASTATQHGFAELFRPKTAGVFERIVSNQAAAKPERLAQAETAPTALTDMAGTPDKGGATHEISEQECAAEWRANKVTLQAQTPGLTWPAFYRDHCSARSNQGDVTGQKECASEWRATKAVLQAQSPGLTWPEFYLHRCSAMRPRQHTSK
jgi:hypothetical protein